MELLLKILRANQIFWTLVFTALIGNVIASNINASGLSEAAINFSMFVAVVAWLTSLYGLAILFADSLLIPIAVLALDGAATFFTLIDGIVLAAKLRATNCGGSLDPKVLGSDWIGFGSADDMKRCREIQASTVFVWFLFMSFAAGLFLSFMSLGRGGGSVRSSRPMSQVRV